MTQIRSVPLRALRNCPKRSMLPGHYYLSGDCRCATRPQAVEEVKRCRRELEAARDALRRAEETLRVS